MLGWIPVGLPKMNLWGNADVRFFTAHMLFLLPQPSVKNTEETAIIVVE